MAGSVHSLAGVAVPHEVVNILSHLRPVVLACEEFEGLRSSWVANGWGLVVVL